jgi:hypothetical protein
MFEEYTPEARRMIFFANSFGRQSGSAKIDSVHVLFGLEREDTALF